MLNIALHAASFPGTGALHIRNWQGSAHDLELAVQRNQDSYYLDADGQWSATQCWMPLPASQGDDEVLADVGPWLVDPLTADQRMTYMFYVRDAAGQDKGVLRMVGELLSSAAADTSAAPVPERKTAPPRPVPAPEPQVEPVVAEVAAAAPAKKSARTGLWVLLVVLVLLLAGVGAGAWWWTQRTDPAPEVEQVDAEQEDTEPESADASEPEPENELVEEPDSAPGDPSGEARAACSPQILGDSQNDIALLQGCVRAGPTSAQVLELIQAAKAAKRCNLVQRLYANRALGGDAEVALAYAREYDPASFQAGGCIDAADAETAVYWYELVLDQQPGNQTAKQALEALQQ